MKQFLRTTPKQDPYLTDPKWRQFYRWRYESLCSFTPFFDAMLPWFGKKAFCYYDISAIYAGAPAGTPGPVAPPYSANQPQGWILRDDAGNPLYIPYNCSGGTCPQFAGDFTNPAFVAYQIAQLKAIVAKGYDLWLDDVNLDIRLSDGAGNQVLPAGITAETWAARMVDYVERIREAFPLTRIVHNSLWQSAAAPELIVRQIDACDYVNLERGFGDPNLTNATRRDLARFIVRVHAYNRHVICEELSQATLATSLPWFEPIANDGDMLAVLDVTPDAWPAFLD